MSGPDELVERRTLCRCTICGVRGDREVLEVPLFRCRDRTENGVRTRQHVLEEIEAPAPSQPEEEVVDEIDCDMCRAHGWDTPFLRSYCPKCGSQGQVEPLDESIAARIGAIADGMPDDDWKVFGTPPAEWLREFVASRQSAPEQPEGFDSRQYAHQTVKGRPASTEQPECERCGGDGIARGRRGEKRDYPCPDCRPEQGEG